MTADASQSAFPSLLDWGILSAIFIVLLIFDFVLTRRGHTIAFRESLALVVFSTVVALAIGAWIFIAGDTQRGVEYISTYTAERALSIDNMFIFLVIFNYFGVPDVYRPRALLIGIVGALIARGAFIAAGVTIISFASWVLFILGAFLIYTAYKVWQQDHSEVKPADNLILRAFRRVMPITDQYHGHKIFIRQNAKWIATPFALVIISLATTDVLFALDSIPTNFGITQDGFVIWSSTAMAVLGMRPLYFLVVDLISGFHLLQYGLALILLFVGAKIIFNETVNQLYQFDVIATEHLIDPLWESFIALAVIVLVLAGSIILSKLTKPKHPPPTAPPPTAPQA